MIWVASSVVLLFFVQQQLPVECVDTGVGHGREGRLDYPPGLGRGSGGPGHGGARHETDAGDVAG